MLQNESVDDEFEHFEDIVEETENEASIVKETEDKGSAVFEKQESSKEFISSSENMKSDSDSSEDEDDPPASDSDSHVSDEEDELVIANDSENLQASKTPSDDNGKQPKVSVTKPCLPGGYDPRHREPSYWYIIFFFQLDMSLAPNMPGELTCVYVRLINILHYRLHRKAKSLKLLHCRTE